MQHLILLLLEIFLNLHYKLFQLTPYHTILHVQIQKLHNNSQLIVTSSTPYIPSIHPNHQILQQTFCKTLNFRHLTLLLQLFERILTLMLHTHNPSNISSNVSNIPTYNTVPPSTITQSTVSQPTYINSSTSNSEPIKPFDGLDYNYTPKKVYNILKHV